MRLPTHHLSGERSEAGETLVEVLISSALMAIVVVAIVAGLATTVLSGHVHREQADANAALVAAMERVKSPSLARVVCATPADYLATAQAASPTLPSGWTIGISSIEYENYAPGTVSWDTSCHETATNTLTLQRITLQLTTSDSRVTPKLSFVKGDY
jgi:Tfp pilus assembly protein PilV